jgi:hypothetical protein
MNSNFLVLKYKGNGTRKYYYNINAATLDKIVNAEFCQNSPHDSEEVSEC